MTWTGFASDNYASVHPAVLRAIADANDGHQVSYGDDDTTDRLNALVQATFGPTAVAYPVFNGTGANVVALQAMTQSWQSTICAQTAHLHVDEGGAPERIAGTKLWTIPTPAGKLTPELVEQQAWGFDDVHRAQPGCVSVAQATELGTVYTAAELRDLADQAHGLGMQVHLDGARLANAAAHLDLPLRALTTDVGVDVVSFGGTKNGGLLAEAVIVLNPDLHGRIGHIRKSAGQLASKMRYLSAQLAALLTDELWLTNARHSNAMARRLHAAVREAVEVRYPVEANAVFATVPSSVARELQATYRFYTWDARTDLVRWMTSWDTTPDDVDRFAAAITTALKRPSLS